MTKMNNSEVWLSILGAFIATLMASFISYKIMGVEHTPMILASTGASAMLIFGLPHSPVSEPWNLVAGHVVSAFVGVTCALLIANDLLASSLAIAFAMVLMHKFKCMHPPGGATAVTAVIGGLGVHEMGYTFVVIPVFLNAIILLSLAIAIGGFRDVNPFEVKKEPELS